jgi:hypothetical protein
MNDWERWQEGNERDLAAAIAWLRSRLTWLSESPESQNSPSPPPLSLAPTLTLLSQQLGLSRFEQEVLLLCAAGEFDPRIPSLCARAQDDLQRPYPTFALAFKLFDEPAWDVLSPERPLRYWRLIEINQPGNTPLTASALRADERIVNYLKGLNYLDDRLAALVLPEGAFQGTSVENSAARTEEESESRNQKAIPNPLRKGGKRRELPNTLPPSQQTSVNTIIQHLQQANPAQLLPLIQLLGTDSTSKKTIASRAAASLGLHLYRLPVGLLPTQVPELETFVRLWQRESLLLPLALYVDASESEQIAASLKQFLERCQGLLFLDIRESLSQLERATLTLDTGKPTPVEQRSAWEALLGEDCAEISAQLASQFNLNLTTIQQVTRSVEKEGEKNGNAGDIYANTLWDACLALTRPRLDNLAQRIDVKATWNDIVLPAEDISLLHQIADQVRQRSTVYQDWGFDRRMNRGMGISALFAGESGTGKTMAAEVIAKDLRLDLYRIDLSAVVNKYIGETEKNLRRLFDAAEDGGAILFFDEADALFGKRSEVKDSHDRYANIEINYLLQRLEAYRGLAILATNLKSSLDAAFMRRLRFIVNFPFPGKEERKTIWQKVFPPQTPTAALDCDRLAKLNLTGGNIHNIALNAAFLAAQARTPVTMPLILTAAKTEFRKLERPINEADFRY